MPPPLPDESAPSEPAESKHELRSRRQLIQRILLAGPAVLAMSGGAALGKTGTKKTPKKSAYGKSRMQ